MSDLGDRLRAIMSQIEFYDMHNTYLELCAEADRLEREWGEARWDRGVLLHQRDEALAEAQAAREVSMEAVRDRDLILEAKMALDLKVEYLTGEGYHVKIPEWRAMRAKIERVLVLADSWDRVHATGSDYHAADLREVLDMEEG
jgi:hypothetical protein